MSSQFLANIALLTELGKRCGIVIYKHCIPNGIN
jgi:hypothetical protein